MVGVRYIVSTFLGYLVLLLAVLRLSIFLRPVLDSLRRVPAQFVLLELRLNSFKRSISLVLFNRYDIVETSLDYLINNSNNT